MKDRRRTFLPVAGAGVAAASLAAVAGARAWFADPGLTTDPFDTVADAGRMPLAPALSLVLLACWGVLLFTRGWIRRAVAVLAPFAAAGLLATVVVGWVTLPPQVSDAVRETVAGQGGAATPEPTGWFWSAAVVAVVSLVTTALAAWWVPSWPEMGSRYDAPGSAAPAEPPPGERSSLDLWRSLDEGRDPTA